MQQPPLILVVEDDAAIRGLIEALLVSEGYAVATAADGQEALTVLRQRQPALILLDMMMPRLDGPSFLAVRAQDPFVAHETPVVLLSATPELGMWAARLGVAGYLAKPFDLDTLLDTVHRHAPQTQPLIATA